MIKSITFKSRKSKKSKFETLLILTEHGLRLVDSNHLAANSMEEFLEFVTGRRNQKNSEVEIVLKHPFRNKKNGKTDFLFTAAPALLSSAAELITRYHSLTGQEKKLLNLILRNYKQKDICAVLNISLNTEKGYRKAVHEKMQIKKFSGISEGERELLLRFTHEK